MVTADLEPVTVESRVSWLLGYIFSHNELSLRLFTNHGFERWGYLPGVTRLDGIDRDVVIMGKRVAA